MSRLDDELRAAFRRQEPSADFTERVLARLAAEVEEPKREPWWQMLLAFLQAQRWAFAAAVVLLVAGLGFVQYQRWREATSQEQASAHPAATTPDAPPANSSNSPLAAHTDKQPPMTKAEEGASPDVGKRLTSAPHEPQRPEANKAVKRHVFAQQHRPPTSVGRGKEASGGQTTTVAAATSPNSTPKSEGEIAKEQLMKALYIASTLINEAKEVAIGGRD